MNPQLPSDRLIPPRASSIPLPVRLGRPPRLVHEAPFESARSMRTGTRWICTRCARRAHPRHADRGLGSGALRRKAREARARSRRTTACPSRRARLSSSDPTSSPAADRSRTYAKSACRPSTGTTTSTSAGPRQPGSTSSAGRRRCRSPIRRDRCLRIVENERRVACGCVRAPRASVPGLWPRALAVRPSPLAVRLLQPLDINLVHLEHGFGDTSRFRGVLVLQHLAEHGRDDLPG